MIASTTTLAERPDLADAVMGMESTWPTFLLQDPVADQFWSQLPRVFPAHQVVALDDAGRVVGKVHSVPFAWAGSDEDLPARGWDAVLERAFGDHAAGRTTTAVSLIEARLAPALRGRELSAELLRAARRHLAKLGVVDLFGPVRPTGKAAEPATGMQEYAWRTRDDGLPTDPWLRVHVRLGARIVKVCPLSMVIPGTLAQWREWTGLPFSGSGEVLVPGALSPVHVSVTQDCAVYVEPNVWVHHRL